ncbi:dCMP deaminase [Mycobacterium phage Astro]|uniref:Cytidine deaminase n=2 Tax=Fromanvirus astro TaxID=1195075 RepID=I6RU24_9CAUD|nr:dCMP deaminase [Mycobacterium phage Smeadley]YP_009638490.1 dCMP deaminase [Mycobacterium phage Astro]AXQ63538.1 deoxycytidylate deaminase [Mycobacterium phage Dixon]WNO26718.1 deoxycytidylate deaminase [Mycobacterium phage Groundhog]AFM54993.1 cytidine deaminase [Mycobacterium phage Astro]AKQ07600.1 cytidine deaminase [Mycobacterium phage Smeadley]
MSRPTWDEYFLGIATAAAERSDCERSKVGAVVVKDRRVRATGYNGAPAGDSGCGTCPRRLANAIPGVSDYNSGETRCVAVHAEANALLYCDREDLLGATLYITREPCYACSNLIRAAGVARVVTPEAVVQVDDSAEAEAVSKRPVSGYGDLSGLFDLLMEPVYNDHILQELPKPGTFGDLRNRSDGSDCVWCTKPPGADCRC